MAFGVPALSADVFGVQELSEDVPSLSATEASPRSLATRCRSGLNSGAEYFSRERWWILGRGLVLVGAIVITGFWISIDRQAPEWDQSHYLDLTYQFVSGLQSHGLLHMAHQIWNTPDGRGPGFIILMILPFLLFGSSPQAGLITNLVLWPVLLLSVGDITSRLYGRRAAVLAMVITASTPLIVGLSHEVLEDFVLTTVVALSIAVLLRTNVFASLRASLVLGVLLGIGMCTKLTYVGFIIGPVGVVAVRGAVLAAREFKSPELRSQARRRLISASVAMGLCALISVAWYLPHLTPTLAYLAESTVNPVGTGPSNPVTFTNLTTFTVGFIDTAESLPVIVIGAIAFVLVVPMWVVSRGWSGPADWFRRWGGAAILITWVVIPFVGQAISPNTLDYRYQASELPGIAIITAALVMSIRVWPVRWAGAGLLSVMALVLTVGMTWPFQVPLLPKTFAVSTPYGFLQYPFTPSEYFGGYDRQPQPVDYMAPLMSYLHAETVDLDAVEPTVCFLEVDPDVNGNAMTYLADVRGQGYVWDNVSYSGETQLTSALESCTFALYVPPPPGVVSANDRVGLQNLGMANIHMTAQDFAVFTGPSRWFPLDFNERVEVLMRSGGTTGGT
jgi:4-amino-4-deoxy-L-arabinose transferase-like glycosyltransferase